MRRLVFCGAVGLIVAGCSRGEPAGSSVADEEQRIREIDAAWSRDLHARNLDAVMTNYDDHAVLLASGQPIVEGKAKIREWFATRMERPDYAPTFAPTKIVVAQSRDIAYELGTYQLTLANAEGNQVTITGKHLVSWEKRDGRWKVTAESVNGDAPPR
jgi:ketosteroid isomerase-like protein